LGAIFLCKEDRQKAEPEIRAHDRNKKAIRPFGFHVRWDESGFFVQTRQTIGKKINVAKSPLGNSDVFQSIDSRNRNGVRKNSARTHVGIDLRGGLEELMAKSGLMLFGQRIQAVGSVIRNHAGSAKGVLEQKFAKCGCIVGISWLAC